MVAGETLVTFTLADPNVGTRFGGPANFVYQQLDAQKVSNITRSAKRKGHRGYSEDYLSNAEVARSMCGAGQPAHASLPYQLRRR